MALPILVMVLFGLVSFGLALDRLQSVDAAALEAARRGVVSPGGECARADAALDGLGLSSTCTVEEACPGDRVVVTITADADVDIPFVGSRTVSRSRRAIVRCGE